MATYRVGIGSFNLKDGAVGLGTESTGLGNLKVEGTVKTTDLDVTGVSTFTRYAGFSADNISVNRDLSLTGEHSTQGDIVVGVNSTFTVSTGATVTVGTVESVSIGTHFSPPTGGIEDRPEVPVEGTVRFNKDLNTLEFYNGVEWRQFTVNNSGASGRGVSGGGAVPTTSAYTGIQYFQIHTLGSAQFFGDLSAGRRYPSAAANHIRGIFHGGTSEDRIDYITMASAGNAIDFDSNAGVKAGGTGASSSTRGVFAGGYQPSLPDVDIDYVEIMTKGTTFDFADLFSGSYVMGSVMNPTRALFAGGSPGSSPHTKDEIQQITFANKANSIDFGNLTAARTYAAGVCNSTRGVFGSGGGYQSGIFNYNIDYVTIASAGNATDFGEPLHQVNQISNGGSTQTRGVWCGGSTSTPAGGTAFFNVMDYITISTTGNATDFGDLAIATRAHAVMSDSHGGLGGY